MSRNKDEHHIFRADLMGLDNRQDMFDNAINEMKNEQEQDKKTIRFLRRVTGILAFVSGGLMIAMVKNRADILEIRELMKRE